MGAYRWYIPSTQASDVRRWRRHGEESQLVLVGHDCEQKTGVVRHSAVCSASHLICFINHLQHERAGVTSMPEMLFRRCMGVYALSTSHSGDERTLKNA